MKLDYFILLILYLGGLTARSGYEYLIKKGRVSSQNRILFSAILLAMCVLWVSWFFICPSDPWPIVLPAIVRWIGLGLLFVGIGLGIGALAQLRGVRNIDHLITTGLYSRIRNPMYLGFILWIFGWAIYYGAAVSLGFGLVGIGNILYWGHLEENDLESCFGEKYQQYRRQTWF